MSLKATGSGNYESPCSWQEVTFHVTEMRSDCVGMSAAVSSTWRNNTSENFYCGTPVENVKKGYFRCLLRANKKRMKSHIYHFMEAYTWDSLLLFSAIGYALMSGLFFPSDCWAPRRLPWMPLTRMRWRNHKFIKRCIQLVLRTPDIPTLFTDIDEALLFVENWQEV